MYEDLMVVRTFLVIDKSLYSMRSRASDENIR